MNGPQTYRDLTAWKRSVDFVEAVYRATERFPRSELFGIVSQMRRAAVSVTANIAEGNSRHSTAAYINHVNVAMGSLGELGALIEVSSRLGFLSADEAQSLQRQAEEEGRLLSGLRTALKRRLSDGHPSP
ncbi:MAG: four helix bundle protein [Vicinamibacterales bacterium]